MLKDPKWDGPPQPHHPSLDGMIDWLETKDPEMRYLYTDADVCLCAKYYKECTDMNFRKKYGQADSTAVLLNTHVASDRLGSEITGCIYTVSAALRRARRFKRLLEA